MPFNHLTFNQAAVLSVLIGRENAQQNALSGMELSRDFLAKMSTSSVYAALEYLERKSYVQGAWDTSSPRPCKRWAATATGRAALRNLANEPFEFLRKLAVERPTE